MTQAQAEAWRDALSKIGTLWCVLLAVTLLDAVISKFREPPQVFHVLAGETIQVTGPVGDQTAKIDDLFITGNPPTVAISIDPVRPGFWFGGAMWHARVAVSTTTAAGDYPVHPDRVRRIHGRERRAGQPLRRVARAWHRGAVVVCVDDVDATAAMMSVSALIVARIALGLGEAAVFPASINMIGRWIPVERRSRATALLVSAISLGTVFSLPVTGWLVREYGWHWPFYLIGAVGLVWYVAWFLYARDGSPPPEAKAAGRVSVYKGKTYYFCADGCKRRVDENPESFLSNPGKSGLGQEGHVEHGKDAHGMHYPDVLADIHLEENEWDEAVRLAQRDIFSSQLNLPAICFIMLIVWWFYRKFGSLQLLLSLNLGFTSSLPQILFPARFGFFLNFLFLSEKYLLIAFLHSFTDA